MGARLESSSATGIDGDQVDNSQQNAGAAYLFVQITDQPWAQKAYIKASNTEQQDEFGSAVAMHQNRFIIGAPREDSNSTGIGGDQGNNSATQSGAAYLYQIEDMTIHQRAYVKAINTDTNDQFGAQLAMSDTVIIIGANGEDSNATGVNGNANNNGASASGAAYAYSRHDADWMPIAYIKASNTDNNDRFGTSVSVSGRNVVAGAPVESSDATGNRW